MSVDPVTLLETELGSLNLDDGSAVRALAQKVEALADRSRIIQVCERSRALRAAVGRLRVDALEALLVHNERDEFIRLTSDSVYMAPVDVATLRVPRYVSIEQYQCVCGVSLMVPYQKHGGPGFGFNCPECRAPYLAKIAYGQGRYRVHIEADARPIKKRKRNKGVR